MNNEIKLLEIFERIFNKVLTKKSEISPEYIDTWDSIRQIDLIISIEQEFNIQFSDDEIGDLLNFELILQIINEKENNGR